MAKLSDEDYQSPLRFNTPSAWTEHILDHFDEFLIDHAAAEKKAAGMATSMISHYPDRPELIAAMADLAVEEMVHFKEVIKIIYDRGLQLAPDKKDAYVHAFRTVIRKGSEHYFLDRLLVGAVIEARGAERFGLIAEAITDQQLQKFYRAITKSEQRHFQVFCELAYCYFDQNIVDQRLDELLDIEAKICAELPLQAMLH